MALRYSARSAWQRVARTAGPLDALSVRHWMPAASAARAITPPSASISLDQVALADAADRRIAAHRADGLDVVRQQQRARTGTRGRERGFGAGVAAADHDHVVAVEGVAHRAASVRLKHSHCRAAAGSALACFLHIRTCTRDGRRQGRRRIGTGLASACRGSQGPNVGGHSAPFFCPGPDAARSAVSTAGNGADATAGRTEQGGSGIPHRGVDMERDAEYVAMRRIRSIAG